MEQEYLEYRQASLKGKLVEHKSLIVFVLEHGQTLHKVLLQELPSDYRA